MDRGAWRAAVPGVAESDAVGSGNTDSNSDPCVRPPDPALGQSPSGRVNLTLSLSEVTAVPPHGSTVTSSRPSHSGQQRLKPHWRVSPAWVQMPRLRGFPLQRGQRILRQDRAVSGRTAVSGACRGSREACGRHCGCPSPSLRRGVQPLPGACPLPSGAGGAVCSQPTSHLGPQG